MTDLPQGFTLDPPSAPPPASGLPEGFFLDPETAPRVEATAAPSVDLPPFLENAAGMIAATKGMGDKDFKRFLGKIRARNARGGSIGGGSAESPILFDIARRFRAGKINEAGVRQELAQIAQGKQQAARFGAETIGLVAGGPILGAGARALGAGRALTGAARIVGSGAGGAAGTKATGGTSEEAALTAAIGSGAEAVGLGVGALIKGGFFRRSAKEGAGAALKAARKSKTTLTPSQVTDSATLDIVDNVVSKSLIGGGRVLKANEAAVAGAAKSLDRAVEKIAGKATRKQLGVIVQDAVEGGGKLFKKRASKLYRKVDRQTAGARVDISAVQATARRLLQSAGLKKTSAQTKTVLDDIISQPSKLSFERAQNIRSDLLAITRTGSDPLGTKTTGAAKLLAKGMSRSMATSARNLSPEALKAWRAANDFFRSGNKTFNNRFVKSLANKEPDAVFDVLSASKSPGVWRRVREIVTNGGKSPEKWAPIQGGFMRRLIRDATRVSGTQTEISGSAIKSALGKKFDADTLKEIFPKASDLASFQRAVSNLNIAQSGSSIGTGKVAIQLTQAGAALGLLTGVAQTASVAVIVAPPVLARLVTNPRFVNWLVAYRIAPNKIARAKAAANILKVAGAAGAQIRQRRRR